MTEKNQNTDEHYDADLVRQIKASAKEIWQAGLGAFSQKARQEQEGQSQSGSIYQQMVKEGKDIERVSRQQLDRNIQSVKSFAFDGVDQVKEKAAGSLHRLESVFDERVSKALGRLGLTTSQDYAVLESKLENTEQRLADLEGVIKTLESEVKSSTNTKKSSPTKKGRQ